MNKYKILSFILSIAIVLVITIGYSPKAYDPALVNTATLDFANTSAGTATDLTITVTGAADGDPVAIGVPNASTVSNGHFVGWVSAANIVTVRFLNNNLVAALNPASGTFKVIVFKK